MSSDSTSQSGGGFGAPPAGFGAPTGGFGEPPGGFGAPVAGFGAPASVDTTSSPTQAAQEAAVRLQGVSNGGAILPTVDLLNPSDSTTRTDFSRNLPAPVLVTGAAGFIGHFLIRRLNEEFGVPVIGFDNMNDYYEVSLKEARLQALYDLDTTNYLSPTEKSNAEKKRSTAPGVQTTMDMEGLTRSFAPSTNPLFHFIQGDLADADVVERVFRCEGFSMVVHLGAQAGVRYSITNPGAYIQSNLVGFANILESTRKHLHPDLLTKEEAAPEQQHQQGPFGAAVPRRTIRHLVYASSSSVYGGNEKTPFSENDCVDHPVSLYAATKKSNELTAHAYSSLYRIPTTGLRFFTVYGPFGRPDMAPAIFTKNILAGKEISLFNFGEMKRDFTYVMDIVEGIIRVMIRPPTAVLTPTSGGNAGGNGNKVEEEGVVVGAKRGRSGDENGVPQWDAMDPSPAISAPAVPFRVFNIGNSAPVPLLDFVSTLGNVLQREVKSVLVPMQKGDVVSTSADTAFLEHVTGFKPSTPLSEGLAAYGAWYKSYYKID